MGDVDYKRVGEDYVRGNFVMAIYHMLALQIVFTVNPKFKNDKFAKKIEDTISELKGMAEQLNIAL